MGMQFTPMYQHVSTKTIEADGDLDVSPYDVVAYDGRFDTVEADEFVGGVGNFSTVLGDSFNGVVLKSSGVITVTPLDTIGGNTGYDTGTNNAALQLLSYKYNCTYSGSIKFKNPTSSNKSIYIGTDVYPNPYLVPPDGLRTTLSAGTEYTYTFTNIKYLYVMGTDAAVEFYDFALS